MSWVLYFLFGLYKVKLANIVYYNKTSLNFPTKIVVLATFFLQTDGILTKNHQIIYSQFAKSCQNQGISPKGGHILIHL